MDQNEESKKVTQASVSIRLDNEEGKNEWAALQARTGLTSKDLLLDVIRLKKDQLEAESGGISELISPEMLKLKEHTERIIQMFSEIVRSEADQRRFHVEEMLKIKNEHQIALDFLRESLDISETNLKQAEISMKEEEDISSEINQRNIELETASSNSNYLIETLRIENESMKQRIGLVDEIEKSNNSLQHQADGLQAELNKYKELLDSSQARISDIMQEREKAVQQAQEAARKDIEQIRYIHTLELDKAVTEADRRVLEAVSKVKDEYSIKLDSLAQKNDALTNRNQELVDRVHALELKQTTQGAVDTGIPFEK